jgi:isoleucyl-tRNA synthetase
LTTIKGGNEAISDLIKAEVNVKEIVLLDDASGVLVKQIKT